MGGSSRHMLQRVSGQWPVIKCWKDTGYLGNQVSAPYSGDLLNPSRISFYFYLNKNALACAETELCCMQCSRSGHHNLKQEKSGYFKWEGNHHELELSRQLSLDLQKHKPAVCISV